MKLQKISENSIHHPGYGAGAGREDTIIFTCPCGEGTVTVEKSNIPGFRGTDILCSCDDCCAKYHFTYENRNAYASSVVD